jgi:heme a synthase
MGFRKLAISTLVAVYVLILVGGVVRSTGSGMGCPDWPKCFGSWVPPTSVEQLPSNYKEIYAEFRNKKNQRFAKVLTRMGMTETASGILNNPAVLVESDFNPTKTWIEYINRIVGVIIGFMIIGVFVSSLRFWKEKRKLTIVAFFTLVLVIFQGWIGSIVVSTNLTPWTITVHMFLALVLVGMLIWLVNASSTSLRIMSSLGFWWLIAAMATLLVQILLGTQVREAIDHVAENVPREDWIAGIAGTFNIHRSFSWMVVFVHLGLIFRLSKAEAFRPLSLTLIVLIAATIITGAGMAYFAVPAFLQPIHLLLATVTFGMQFLMLLKISPKEQLEMTTG